MKNYQLLLAFVFAVLSNLAFATEPKDALAAFHAAMRSGDQAGVLAQLAPDAVIYESGYVERSKDEYASHHLGEDIAFAKTSTRKLLQQSVQMDANLASIWGEIETTSNTKMGVFRSLATETVLFKRVKDTWLITHIHWSSRKMK